MPVKQGGKGLLEEEERGRSACLLSILCWSCAWQESPEGLRSAFSQC